MPGHEGGEGSIDQIAALEKLGAEFFADAREEIASTHAADATGSRGTFQAGTLDTGATRSLRTAPVAKQTKQRKEKRERTASLILRFSEDHLWVRVDGDRVQIGLSESGQKALGEIIAVDLPDIGDGIEQGEQFGELESTRTVQELIAPVTGAVTAVNTDIDGTPSLVNEDPYHDGWLIEVELSDERELDDLMAAEEYDEFVEQEDQGE